MVCCYCFFPLLFIYSDDAASLESTHTLTNETFNESNDACETSDVITAPKRKKNNKQDTEMNGECSNEALSPQLSTSPSSFGCSSPGSGDIDAKDDDNDDGHQNAGKNSARYKRRNSNNGNSISLPRTPLATPMPRRREFARKRSTTTIKTTTLTTAPTTATTSAARRDNIATDKNIRREANDANSTTNSNSNGNNKDSGSNDLRTDTKSVNGRKKRNHLNMVVSCSSNKVFEQDSERDSDSLASINKQRAASSLSHKSDAMRRLSVSNATLRNVNISFLLPRFYYFIFCSF